MKNSTVLLKYAQCGVNLSCLRDYVKHKRRRQVRTKTLSKDKFWPFVLCDRPPSYLPGRLLPPHSSGHILCKKRSFYLRQFSCILCFRARLANEECLS